MPQYNFKYEPCKGGAGNYTYFSKPIPIKARDHPQICPNCMANANTKRLASPPLTLGRGCAILELPK